MHNNMWANVKTADGKDLPKEFVEQDAIVGSQALRFVPVGTKIYRDDINCRWQTCIVMEGRRVSRSFAYQLHSFEGGLRLGVRWCWTEYLRMQGLPVESCPIKGIFEVPNRPAAEATASSSSSAS